jgi:alginate O-acetyltransferase complex protein AlgI
MSFISFEFYFFVLILVLLYRYIPRAYKIHFLLVASVIFYASFSFHGLVVMSSVIVGTFFLALQIERAQVPIYRKLYLCLGLALNLEVLFYFKYLNFLLQTFNDLFSGHVTLSKVLIPVGISFCTFQSMSYIIDVYRGKPVEKELSAYALYILFFPLVLAGPIERSHQLIEQLRNNKLVSHFKEGLPLIAFGLFKKLVVADNLRIMTSAFFYNQEQLSSATPLTLILMGYAFSLQYYFDFSAYSEIARGLGSLFGIRLNINFFFPFIALSPREFWKSWHITLGRWFRDYVHVPLLKTRVLRKKIVPVTLITFLLIGLWHGASWNFALFGIFQGAWYLIFEFARHLSKNRVPHFVRFTAAYLTINFIFFSSGLIFALTRWADISMVTQHFFQKTWMPAPFHGDLLKTLLFYVLPASAFEVFLLKKKIYSISSLGLFQQSLFYSSVVYGIFIFGDFSLKEFLYFNF